MRLLCNYIETPPFMPLIAIFLYLQLQIESLVALIETATWTASNTNEFPPTYL